MWFAFHLQKQYTFWLLDAGDDFLFTFERIDNILRPLFYTSSVEKITGYTQSEFLLDSTLLLK
ncbi:MAG: hypothetical protein WCJ54_09295, partial [Actinomycetota bacterium]